MTRRHLINAPDEVIPEALAGFALTYPHLVAYDSEAALVVRRELTPGKVGLVSGGGSGHEPLHAGFVGTGMLDVAVAGAVFASPTALQIHTGTVAADQGAGVLQIVKNYTGDVLNFSIAREIAADENIAVETVLVDDDVATTSVEGRPPRDRGGDRGGEDLRRGRGGRRRPGDPRRARPAGGRAGADAQPRSERVLAPR